MYPQGVCRIRKPAYAGNGCAIFPTFDTAQLGKKIRCSAADDLFRGSIGLFQLRLLCRAVHKPMCRSPAGEKWRPEAKLVYEEIQKQVYTARSL